jgi:4-alpha-glucanotransferase
MSQKPLNRKAGALLHVSSLPGAYGVGDLGAAARGFCDFLYEGGLSIWQTLPLNPVGKGNSPYSSDSAFAIEPLFICLKDLKAQGLLKSLPPAFTVKKTQYRKSQNVKGFFLREAFAEAKRQSLFKSRDFLSFKGRNKFWLSDYCLFKTLEQEFRSSNFFDWPKEFKFRNPRALDKILKEDKGRERFLYHQFLQFIADKQWRQLRKYGAERRIEFLGDLPIFLSYQSADVWSHPDLFLLKKDLAPKVVAGCPPDLYNPNGQLWGNALFDWQELKKDQFAYWQKRLARMLWKFDLVRLDHFIGFQRFYAIPANAKSAKTGKWTKGPGAEFFRCMKKHFKALPVIAEDLGSVSEDVWRLRDDFGIPGMKVLQFAFDEEACDAYVHKPCHYPENCVAYTGTHDNQTMVGFYRDLRRESQRGRGKGKRQAKARLMNLKSYLGSEFKDCWPLIRDLMNSQAARVVIPMQDLLNEPSQFRMNRPGVAEGNWQYRLRGNYADKELKTKIHGLLKMTDRLL